MFDTKPASICTTCGYIGNPQNVTKGSFTIEVVLWLLFLLPGLIYSIWRMSSKYEACPKCKGTSMIPVDSPIGQKVIGEHKSSLETDPVETYKIESQKENAKNTILATVVIGAVIILVAISAFVGQENAQEATTPTSAPTTEVISPTPVTSVKKEESLKYEIVKKTASGTTLNMRVYTQEREDQRIIKLTDKLLAENSKGLTHLFIDYFDDKQLATSYFDKLANESISEAEKDKMFIHYIANLKYNTATGHKVLVKNQNNDWVELKKY